MRHHLSNRFKTAIICASVLEFDTIQVCFDDYYEEDEQILQRESGEYWQRLGRIGHHNVALARLPDIGREIATDIASRLQDRLLQLELVLVVGVCGSAPLASDGSEILLGDVIISNKYTMGKQYPDDFGTTRNLKEMFGHDHKDFEELMAFLTRIQTRSMGRQIQKELLENLKLLQSDVKMKSQYPGPKNDLSLEASNFHSNKQTTIAPTSISPCYESSITTTTANNALESDFGALSCNGSQPRRLRLSESEDPNPVIHFRDLASANYEMDGAGIFGGLPCVVIKGVSTHFEGHRNTESQCYAAATAASYMKAFLIHYRGAANSMDSGHSQLVQAESPLSTPQELHLCECICHKRYRFNTPKSLIDWIGVVSVAHSGIIGMSQACNDTSCLRPASPFGHLTVSWPSWLSKRIASFVYSQTPSPELLLRVSTVQPAGAQVFHYAADGNVPGLQDLFGEGKASPFDISSNGGKSLLRVAVSYNQTDVCEFLMSKNADPFLEDYNHLCAFDLAWDNIFAGRLPNNKEFQLRALFPWTERLEERRFSRLHKAVLNLLHIDLKRELELSPQEAINQTDENGMTPLSWASRRGDINAARLLIKYGCDVNLANKHKKTPLHYAVKTGSTSLVFLLLSAGANVHSPSRDRTTPLHQLVISHDSPEILETIIQCGAAIDSPTSIGATPLMCSVQFRHPESAKVLLSSGADVNKHDCQGWSVLQQAILWNSHDCIRHILNYPTDWTHLTAEGESVIHIMAECADIQTMRVLLSHPVPRCFPKDHKQKCGQTAHDISIGRSDGQEWQRVFEKLLRHMTFKTTSDEMPE